MKPCGSLAILRMLRILLIRVFCNLTYRFHEEGLVSAPGSALSGNFFHALPFGQANHSGRVIVGIPDFNHTESVRHDVK
jgi:hypothetical protein